MKILEELGIIMLAVILCIGLHIVAALLNTTPVGLLTGIVCYLWAYLICRK